jgi:hypothetical protein
MKDTNAAEVKGTSPLRCGKLLTKVFPAFFFHERLSSSCVARAQSEHSRYTERLEESITSRSKALSSPRLSAVIVGGRRTAEAASARFAKTPSLLKDMVGMLKKEKVDRKLIRLVETK